MCRPEGVILLLDYQLLRHAPVRLLTRCLSPWLRFAFGGRYDARTEQYVSAAGLRSVWRQSYVGDPAVSLVLQSVSDTLWGAPR